MLWSLVVIGPIIMRGVADMVQTRQAVRRNFPVIGHGRYLLEQIRPEINQYFVETNTDGRPFSRNDRSVVYQRAKGELDTLPFGTQRDVYAPATSGSTIRWRRSSPITTHARVVVGGAACTQPYSASILNVSAMSYGSLSKNAVLALNGGAQAGRLRPQHGRRRAQPVSPRARRRPHLADRHRATSAAATPDGRFDPERVREARRRCRP